MSLAHVLALDEPTNHLDIPACETLEETIADFDGTLMAVSHDRYFLDTFFTRLFAVEDGRIDQHPGSYSDLRARQRAHAVAADRATDVKLSKAMAAWEAASTELAGM
jgi:ATP-binding cassette subfamily F protein 3